MIDVVTLKRRKEQRIANVNRNESAAAEQVSTSLSFESAGTAGSELSGSTSPSADSSVAMSNSTSGNEKSGGGDKHVSQLLDELQEATDRVVELEEEQKGAEARMETLERKLYIARRDANDAQARQEAQEGNLRDIISQYKKLEEGKILKRGNTEYFHCSAGRSLIGAHAFSVFPMPFLQCFQTMNRSSPKFRNFEKN